MSRIPTPASIAEAPEASRPLLEAAKKQLGVIPNMFRLIGNSPATLEGYLSLNGALAKGTLSVATRERLALAVAQANGCGYCLAAHSYLGKNVAKLSEAEITAARHNTSEDAKAAAAVRFAAALVRAHGKVEAGEVEAVRAAGYSDSELLEIVGHVALNVLTNYVNESLGTEVDFPKAQPLAA